MQINSVADGTAGNTSDNAARVARVNFGPMASWEKRRAKLRTSLRVRCLGEQLDARVAELILMSWRSTYCCEGGDGAGEATRIHQK